MTDGKRSLSGSWLVFLGAVCWSLNSPLIKYLDLDPVFMCGFRSLIAGIVLLPFLRPKKLVWSKWMPIYLVAYAGLCTCVVVSLTMTSAPIAIGMQYTSIIWLFLAAWIISKKFSINRFIPVALTSIGVVLFMTSSTDSGTMMGNTIAFCEGILFAFMTVGSQKSSGTNPLGLTSIANLFTGIAIFAVRPSCLTEFTVMTGRDWLVMLILGVVQIGVGYTLYNMGAKKISSQKTVIIALWEMILGPLWVVIFLKEYPSTIVIIGFVIILIGLLLDAKLNSEDERSE